MFSRHAGLSNPSCVTAAAFSSPNPDRQKHQKIRRPRQRRRHLNMMRGALGSIIVPAPQKCREIGGPTLCLARVRTRIASRSLLGQLEAAIRDSAELLLSRRSTNSVVFPLQIEVAW